MHTIKYEEFKTNFTHNHDLSGHVMIEVDGIDAISVHGNALLKFVADYIRHCRINELESMDYETVLGIKGNR